MSSGYLRHPEIVEIAAELEKTDFEALEQRSRGRLAGGVYRWHSEPKPDVVRLLYKLLRYYADAAANGHGLIMWRI